MSGGTGAAGGVFPDADIDRCLADASPESLAEARGRFRVATPEQANWALRRVRRATKLLEGARSLAEAEIARVREWLAGEEARYGREVGFFTGLLEEYHRRLLEEDPSRRTVRLPEGQLEVRALPPEFERDEGALLAWARQRHPDLVVVKETVDWAGLKKRLKVVGTEAVDPETGEVVPGIVVHGGRDRFRVRLRE